MTTNQKVNIFSNDKAIYKHLQPGLNFSIKFVNNDTDIVSINDLIITQLRIQESERIQVSSSFDEITHIGAFGRDPTRLSLSGYVFLNESKFPGMQTLLHNYVDKWRAFKASAGDTIITITGPFFNKDGTNKTINGIATSIQYSINSQMTNIIEFTIDFIEVSGTIKLKEPVPEKSTLELEII